MGKHNRNSDTRVSLLVDWSLTWRSVLLGGALLAGAQSAQGGQPSDKAASAPTSGAASTKVKFVRTSREPLSGPLLFAKQLPRTFSVDPLTAEEIMDVQRTNYKESTEFDPTPPTAKVKFSLSWSLDPGGCMQWLFIRHQPADPWRAIGAKGLGGHFIKVNGMFRVARIGYSIPSMQDPTKKHSWEVPGDGPGGGSSLLTDLTGFLTMTELLNYQKSGAQTRVPTTAAPNSIRPGFFSVLEVGELRVAQERVACTHLRAMCRQYTGRVQPGSAIVNRSEADRTINQAGRETIAFDIHPSLSTELAIEDMCPFATNAMVQRPLNARLGGGSDLFKYSFPDNPGLRGALRPIVEGAK